MNAFDPYGIIQLRILFYFFGTLFCWFTFYFIIDALKRVESFTKKKTDWKLVYVSLPLLLISPIAEIQSYYFLGRPLSGIEELIASGFLVMSAIFLLMTTYSFKRNLKVKMMMPGTMLIASLVFIASDTAWLVRTPDFVTFATIVLYSLSYFFLAISFWIVGSYTKDFHSIYPMPVFLITSSILLLTGQILNSYASATHYMNFMLLNTFDFASTIFMFLAFTVAAISTYVFKKTVLEFKIDTGSNMNGTWK
ncbi:MAG: hypothetical protein NT067_06770 [Candidatus Diapherotrites archaeon]|nr:hypothetical protein [Candidatus Diapherotrites archaeon]